MTCALHTPPIIRAIPSDGPCGLWLSRPRIERGDESSSEPAEERRQEDRRGRGIKIFRFTNERRAGDRRGRSGRGQERLLLPVQGQMRHQGVSYDITTADISAKGARLLDAPPLPLGALVRLVLEPDDDLAEYPLIAWAEVRSFCSERAMLGVQFVGLRPCDARRLSRLVGDASQKG